MVFFCAFLRNYDVSRSIFAHRRSFPCLSVSNKDKTGCKLCQDGSSKTGDPHLVIHSLKSAKNDLFFKYLIIRILYLI
jgi:hypothetical protein